MKLDRRLNILIYLNHNWKENNGGHLELWDKEMKNCEKKVLPIFNRMVIFSTTDFSYHGNPNKVKVEDFYPGDILELKSGATQKAFISSHDYEDTNILLKSVDCVISPLSTILLEALIVGKPIICFMPLDEVEN